MTGIMIPTSDHKTRLLAAIRREPSPTRLQARRQILWIVLAAMIVAGALFLATGGMRPGARPFQFVVLILAGSIPLALLAVWGAFSRGRSMLGRPSRWLWAIALATPLLLFGWMLFCNSRYPELAVWHGRIGLRCLALSLAFAAWPLALITRARREKDPTHPAVTGAARGSAVGALAWVLVTLWCPQAHPAHIALGHFLPIVVLAAYGAWIGRRWTRVSVSV